MPTYRNEYSYLLLYNLQIYYLIYLHIQRNRRLIITIFNINIFFYHFRYLA